jgi:hypothetical protein
MIQGVRFIKSVVTVGIGIILGLVAGVIAGAFVGVGIAIIFNIL